MKSTLVLAVLVRLLIMPFYFHPDIKTYHFQAAPLKNGVWNIYSYLSDNKQNLTLKDDFVYFPAAYYFLGGYQILISPFLGKDFPNWLSDASQTASERVGVYRYLFLLKLPFLILDILIAFLILNFFNDIKQKKLAFTIWLFNPFTIILIYIFSNIDIIPVLFSVVSLLFAVKGKIIPAAFLLGLGAGFKAYPLLFLPFLLLQKNGIKEKFITSFAGLVPFAFIISPFWQSQSFKDAALVSGLTTRIVFGGLSIGFQETLIVSIISISALFFFGLFNFRKDNKDIWKYYLAILLLLFSFIHFHIQWLLWVAPFLVILIVKDQRFRTAVILLSLCAFSIPLLYNDKSMTVALLSGFSNLYNLLPAPFAIVQKFYDPYTIQSVLHSILVGGSLVSIWKIFKD